MVSLSLFAFQNFDGFFLNEYSQESSLQVMLLSATSNIIAAVLFAFGWILQRKGKFAGHSEKVQEEDGYTNQHAQE